MSFDDFTQLSDDDALAAFGKLIDSSFDAGDLSTLRDAQSIAKVIATRELRPDLAALLCYFEGNLWASIRVLKRESDLWKWDQPETREEIIAFRRAITHPGYARLQPTSRCQIATNLGNLLSTVGRFVEALAYYDRALAENPSFGMALGNKGQCLLGYARALYDSGHRPIFAGSAEPLLRRACGLPLEPGAREAFSRLRETAETAAAGHTEEHLKYLRDFPIGDAQEKAYRSWALQERLFLHPVNDVGPYEIAARDVLHLPTVVLPTATGSAFHGFYNQLKQEFVAARALLFEGLTQGETCFVDRDVRLLDTLDGAQFGFAIEKAKMAFRLSYSVLDKVAVFLAHYFNLSVPLHSVNFRKIWYVDGKQERGLRPEFDDRQNWPLRGLFWLAKDLHETDEEFHSALEPSAREIAKLRNQLEHQYAKVVSDPVDPASPNAGEMFPDPIAYRIGRKDLDGKALTILKMARAALIYLSLAVHENERLKPASPDRKSIPISLRLIE
jgi:tetratricopeptide (TPR) repeat protein